MQTVKSVSWVRMVLAFAAVLIVAGSGMALAIGPNPSYVPQSSVLLGPSTVAPGATSIQYTLIVTFTNGATASFPPTTGATFTAVRGTITSGGVYGAPATTGKDRIQGTFAQNGTTTSASRFIAIQ